jgi:phosphatidylinositol alpha-1,6-mannosyltransferase
MRTLVVTNDFPPRAGGIQTFVYELARRQWPESLVVFAPNWPGAAEFDAAQPFPVIRHTERTLLPVPSVSRRICEIAVAENCTSVWFGAAAPLALLGKALRSRTGVQRVIASTHGHEAGLSRLPVTRQMLQRIAHSADAVTFLGDYTGRRLAPALKATRLVHLPPGVDTKCFHPGVDGSSVRSGLDLTGRPTVVCVSRLVPRKGQDILIRALPRIAARVPDTALLIVGGGPDMPRLQRLAASTGVADDVVFTGAVPAEELPAHYAAGDVFAMPCRTRYGGLDVEGLGIVYLEASAMGMPVVAGDSGGAPDAVREGETGYVVDGRSVEQVADRVAGLLADPRRARTMGHRGREWVEQDWQWDVLAARLRGLLTGPLVP